MTEITIPRVVYDQQMERLKGLYVDEFGADALSDRMQSFSRLATISRYARAMRFWERNLPEVRPGLTLDQIATHALCTNANEQLRSKVREMGIENEVQAALRDHISD